jgi:hypothetical protein
MNFTTFQNLNCTCGKPTNRQPLDLDSDGQESSTSVDVQSAVFVSNNALMFMVFDDLKIVPSSFETSMQLLIELGYSDLTQLEEIKRNIGKQEVCVGNLNVVFQKKIVFFFLCFETP